MGCCASREEPNSKQNSQKNTKKSSIKLKSRNSTQTNASASQSNPSLEKKGTGLTRAKFIKTSSGTIRKNFTVIKKLQAGIYGDVKLAVDNRNNLQREIKEINKSLINPEMEEKGWEEVYKLVELDHPNIGKVVEIRQSSDKIYFIFEYLKGGNLFDRILQNRISEYHASCYMRDILTCMQYFHSKGIINRNIRPENIVFESTEDDSVLKLMNFELSPGICQVPIQTDFLDYLAPEVRKGDHNQTASDIWSLGVVLYIIMIGRPPFTGLSINEITRRINENFLLTSELFSLYSEEIKDLLSKMLNINYKNRITAVEALNHPWIVNRENLNKSSGNEEVLTRIARFQAKSIIKTSILTFIISQFTDIAGEKEYIKIFKSLDTNDDGVINKAELIEGCKILALEDIAEVEEILKNCDIDQSGCIEYSEFIVAATNWNTAAQIRKLRNAFEVYDTSGDGKLSFNELKEAVPGIEHSEWSKFFEEADVNKDGMISFDEFRKFLLKDN
ncbi:unnamed protein product [Blepharisma stoltei]|uniref:Calcium-dependent protein kinase n=1 Tax=Blepharisma stoltei TaxID=1481888 RepID=A0AAU9ITB4_9CILI|nr:unnamed protein product [Blepharisma stoltei]